MIIYQDDHLLVLNKPYGLPVQGGPGISRHVDGMLEGFRNEAGDRPRLVHRLDRDTTGVLLIARTPGVAAKLAAAFRGRDMEKTYWAVVAGRPVPVEGEIDLPLKRIGGDRGERTAPAERDDEDAARAITEYRTLDHAARKLAWLELKPHTGRTHQLRVHCVAIRAPILGDVKYARPGPEQRLRRDRRRSVGEDASARPLPHVSPPGGRHHARRGRVAAAHDRNLPHARLFRPSGPRAAARGTLTGGHRRMRSRRAAWIGLAVMALAVVLAVRLRRLAAEPGEPETPADRGGAAAPPDGN